MLKLTDTKMKRLVFAVAVLMLAVFCINVVGAMPAPAAKAKVESKAKAKVKAKADDRKRIKYTQDDLMLLARLVYGEARGESFTGQVAVAAVVLNRLEDGRFGSTIREVIYEQDAFTVVNDGQINLKPNSTAIKAAKAALEGEDPTDGALYYFNPAKSNSAWMWSRTVTGRIGSHLFLE